MRPTRQQWRAPNKRRAARRQRCNYLASGHVCWGRLRRSTVEVPPPNNKFHAGILAARFVGRPIETHSRVCAGRGRGLDKSHLGAGKVTSQLLGPESMFASRVPPRPLEDPRGMVAKCCGVPVSLGLSLGGSQAPRPEQKPETEPGSGQKGSLEEVMS